MARQKSGTDLEVLRRQQIELAQKIKAVEAKARQKEKADNERREQITGRILLAYVAANPESEATKTILKIIDSEMVRPSERELFFDVLPAPANGAPVLSQTEEKTLSDLIGESVADAAPPKGSGEPAIANLE